MKNIIIGMTIGIALVWVFEWQTNQINESLFEQSEDFVGIHILSQLCPTHIWDISVTQKAFYKTLSFNCGQPQNMGKSL